MSGAEALLVLGLLANIAGIIDVSCKALERIQDVKNGKRDLPKAFQDIQDTLPLLRDALDKTKFQIEGGTLSERSCKSVGSILSDCSAKMNELELIFRECKPKENATWFEREWKAVLTLRQDRKVEELAKHIWRLVSLLTYHHVVSPPIESRNQLLDLSANLSIAQKQPTRYFSVPKYSLGGDDFMGRTDELQDLASKLCQPGKHTRVAIVGLGGIGKSRLALQCAEYYKVSDISVFWIYAGTADRMRNGTRDVAKEIGLAGCDDPSSDVLELLRQWLSNEESGKWLLIYDNVDDIDLMYPERQIGLATYFPQSRHGSILITTRNRQVGIKFAAAKNTLRLEALTIDESIALMAAKLRNNDSELSSRKRLAETLEGIPLAIVQASAFIQENESTSVDGYIALYEASDADKILLLSRDFEDHARDTELQNPVAATWAVTFEYLKEHRPLAADTLCMMSIFDPRLIPEAFISAIAQGEPAMATNLELTISTLQAYSLVTSRDVHSVPPGNRGRSFDLHRLVRLATRNWLTETSTYDYWVAEAIDMMSSRYDELKMADYDTKWKVKSNYLPHALALIASPQLQLRDDDIPVTRLFDGQAIENDHAVKGHICPSCTANILTEMLSRNRSWVQKLRMTRKAVAIMSHVFGPGHVLTLNHRWDEARAAWRLEETVGSDVAFRSVLQGYTSTLGPYHMKTLRTGRFLAETLNDQGSLNEAEQVLLQNIAACKQEYGERHQLTLEAMQSLSTTLGLQGRHEEAVSMNMRIQSLTESLQSKYKVSKHYVMLSEYSKAEAVCLQMLEDRDALERDEYVSIDKVWQTLGKIYRKQKSYDKAEQVLLQALPRRRNAYGENSRLTLYTKLYLADTYYHQGKYPEAESIQIQAIEPMASHLGEFNSEVLDIRWDLAWTWLKQGRFMESKKLALEVVDLVLKTRGDQHQQYVGMVEDLKRGWGIEPDGNTTAPASADGKFEDDHERRNWRSMVRARSRSHDAFRHDLRTL